MTATVATSVPTATAPAERSAGRLLMRASVVLLCLWVLGPIYLLLVNTLNTPEAVAQWPKSLIPSFDLGSLHFFATYEGIPSALLNSILVAGLTMVLSIGIGAPAGYALARFRFRGKNAFRMLVLMTRAFPLPLLALPLAVFFIEYGLDDSVIGSPWCTPRWRCRSRS